MRRTPTTWTPPSFCNNTIPYIARVRAPLARYLLAEADEDLRRRVAVLRRSPFPPGSRSLNADDAWHALAESFPRVRAFIYGTNESAVVYTYDSTSEVLSIELAIRDGAIVGR